MRKWGNKEAANHGIVKKYNAGLEKKIINSKFVLHNGGVSCQEMANYQQTIATTTNNNNRG